LKARDGARGRGALDLRGGVAVVAGWLFQIVGVGYLHVVVGRVKVIRDFDGQLRMETECRFSVCGELGVPSIVFGCNGCRPSVFEQHAWPNPCDEQMASSPRFARCRCCRRCNEERIR